MTIQDQYLMKIKHNRRKIRKALQIFQDVQNAIHHLASLMTFGIKRITQTASNKHQWKHIQPVQTMINDTSLNHKQKKTN